MDSSAIEQAYAIIKNNRYMTLATCGRGKPWAAPIAYAVDNAYNYYFYSATNSVHGQHIRSNSDVAVAIFDSTAPSDTADGLQMVGKVSEVHPRDLQQVMDFYFKQSFPDPEVRARWTRPAEDFMGKTIQRFYRFVPSQVFKPDPTSLKVDVHMPVDLNALRRMPVAQ